MTLFTGYVTHPVHAALFVDAGAGVSVTSEYIYFDKSDTGVHQWIDFKPINGAVYLGGASIDIYKSAFQLGVRSGFIRRFDLFDVKRTTGSEVPVSSRIGEMVAIPLTVYVQGTVKPFLIQFGMGPVITRFNINRVDLDTFTVSSQFAYYFGLQYVHRFWQRLDLFAGASCLVNSPVRVHEFLPEKLQDEIHDAVYQKYNRYDFVSIVSNISVECGVRYEFTVPKIVFPN